MDHEREQDGIDALIDSARKPEFSSISTGAEDIAKGVHISFSTILKWIAGLGAVFGAGYVLRGVADSTNGVATMVNAFRPAKEEDGEAVIVQAEPARLPPSPEELREWNQRYQAAMIPRIPTVPREPYLPPAPERRKRQDEFSIVPWSPDDPIY